MVRRLHGTGIILREDTHGEKTHTERGNTRKGGTHRVGTHMEGWNIHGKGNTRNMDYAEKGEGTHTGGMYTVRGLRGTGITRKRERGHTRSGNTHRGDVHGKGTAWNGNYTEKEKGTYTERGQI